MRADLASSGCLGAEFLGRLNIVVNRVRFGLLCRSDHVWTEWMFRVNVGAFAGPPMLGARALPAGREAVLGYRGSQRPCVLWLGRKQTD
jgi:hypothetical protein